MCKLPRPGGAFTQLSHKNCQIDHLNNFMNRLWIRSDINISTVIPEKYVLRKLLSKHSFQWPLPLVLLPDYYMNDLLTEYILVVPLVMENLLFLFFIFNINENICSEKLYITLYIEEISIYCSIKVFNSTY